MYLFSGHPIAYGGVMPSRSAECSLAVLHLCGAYTPFSVYDFLHL